MVRANQLMVDDDFLAVVQTLANGKTQLRHKPFLVNKFVPRREVNDRGAFVFGQSYNAGDQVDWMGYQFIATVSGLTDYPIDPVTRDPSGGWTQPWYSCYQRLRDALNETINPPAPAFPLFEPSKQSVSGPWPCQNPDIHYDDLAFYYADTGSQESVSLSGTTKRPGGAPDSPVSSLGKVTTAQTETPTGGLPEADSDSGANPFQITAVAGPPGQGRLEYTSAVEFQFVVGGTEPVRLDGTFGFFAYAIRGVQFRLGSAGTTPDQLELTATLDQNDPSGLVSVDASLFFPVSGWTKAFNGWSQTEVDNPYKFTGLIIVSAAIDAIVAPGTYILRVNSSAQPNNRAGGTVSITNPDDPSTVSISGAATWAIDTFIAFDDNLGFTGTASYLFDQSVETPGVHDAKKVFKIVLPTLDPITKMPMGLIGGVALYKNADPAQSNPFLNPGDEGQYPNDYIFDITESPPYLFLQPPVPPRDYQVMFSRWYFGVEMQMGFTTTTPGYWMGKTPPAASLGLRPYEQMPWNQFPVTNSISDSGNAAINRFLGFILPYQHGTLIDGAPAMPAYNYSDAPGWIPGTNNHEMLPWPKRWKPLTTYPPGWSILDSNGNLQTCGGGRSGQVEPNWPTVLSAATTEPDSKNAAGGRLPGAAWRLTKTINRHGSTISRNTDYALGDSRFDDNGNVEVVVVAGKTAADPPQNGWPRDAGTQTADGTVTWKLLIVVETITPAVARITPVIYPSFWENPSPGQTDPPPVLLGPFGDGSFDFKPQGWFIYRVALNRIPQKKSTDKPSSAPVAVTLGCVRNGQFVAFGTYATGQIIDAYWPVFTNTALCYQAAERVDIQAQVLTCGLNYALWGHTDFPFAATYLNDVETLLNLIQ